MHSTRRPGSLWGQAGCKAILAVCVWVGFSHAAQTQPLSPPQQFIARLAEARGDNPAVLFELALWARRNGLADRADALCRYVLQVCPEFAPARGELGLVAMDGQWFQFEELLARAHRPGSGGQAALPADLLETLRQAAEGNPRRQLQVGQLEASALLRAKRFREAAERFSSLAARAQGAEAVRFAAIAEVLSENPDGLYVLPEVYPPAAVLSIDRVPMVGPGPASLADPMVLEAALVEKARGELDAGRKALAGAIAREGSDPAAAREAHAQAFRAFDRADALSEDVSTSYRLEEVRRRIAQIRKGVDEAAERFDQAVSRLGQQELTSSAYQETLQELLDSLSQARTGLQSILRETQPYPKQLLLETRWAQTDLNKIRQMYRELSGELNEER